MIGTSFKEYVGIRLSIFFLHYFPLLLVLTLVLLLVTGHEGEGITVVLEILSIAEVIFYVLVFIPKYRALQKPGKHPEILPLEERKRLFDKCIATVEDGERYLSKWFLEAPLSEIRRENVKEFFCWALLNKAVWGPAEEEELEGYADKVEAMLGRKLGQGRGSAVPFRLTLDPVIILHRPLLWYFLISAVDAYTYIKLLLFGFSYHRLPLKRFLTVFPFRLITLTTRKTSPSNIISYWHLPHTSKTRKPILFIHGIGVGLWVFSGFLTEVNKAHRSADDGQVGIIAIELMPINSHITGEMPDNKRICREILAILNKHGWDSFVLASQSYGTVITANMLKDPHLSPRIDSALIVDPVVFLLHLPEVAYNFLRRPPKHANEYQLHYFASTDMMIAHTLGRHFFWAENILWKEDIEGRKVTVTLGGKDLIVNTLAVGRYLTQDEQPYERFLSEGENNSDGEDAWQERTWKGEGLDVIWFRDCDHANQFDYKRHYRRLVEVTRAYSAQTDS